MEVGYAAEEGLAYPLLAVLLRDRGLAFYDSDKCVLPIQESYMICSFFLFNNCLHYRGTIYRRHSTSVRKP